MFELGREATLVLCDFYSSKQCHVVCASVQGKVEGFTAIQSFTLKVSSRKANSNCFPLLDRVREREVRKSLSSSDVVSFCCVSG